MRRLSKHLFAVVCGAGMLLAPLGSGAVTADDTHPGAKTYKQCSVCHLADGKGVAGAYPPLGDNVLQLAQSEDGRDYLTFVVIKGVGGVLEVGGTRYMGYMPPVGAALKDDAIAELLNYVAAHVAKPSGDAPAAFTAKEIATRRAKVVGAYTPNTVGKLRAAAIASAGGD